MKNFIRRINPAFLRLLPFPVVPDFLIGGKSPAVIIVAVEYNVGERGQLSIPLEIGYL